MKTLELDSARERLSELAGESVVLGVELSRAQQVLREVKARLFAVEADAVVGRASPRDLRGAQEAVVEAELAVEEAQARLEENARQDALLRTGISKLEEDSRGAAHADFGKRHRAAVKNLREVFARFLECNDSVRALEQEAAQLGLGRVPVFSWGDFRTPSYAASMERVALWLRRTEDYIK